MHRLCQSVSCGERYVIIVLVVSLMLCVKAVTHVMIIYMYSRRHNEVPVLFTYDSREWPDHKSPTVLCRYLNVAATVEM